MGGIRALVCSIKHTYKIKKVHTRHELHVCIACILKQTEELEEGVQLNPGKRHADEPGWVGEGYYSL